MALKAPSPSFEGTFLTGAFLSLIPFPVIGTTYALTESRLLVLPLLASMVLASGHLFYTMILTGYSQDGLYRAKFMRGGAWSAVYWFHLLVVAAFFLGSSCFLGWAVISGAI